MLNTKLHLNNDVFLKNAKRISIRQGFGDGILELVKKNSDILVLTADLASSLKILPIQDSFPKNFIQVGIAEQNMAGIAAGLALSGKIPFITSFAIWNPGRNWEQIRTSICLSNANVKIIGSHAGLSHSYDGAAAQCLEDIALARVLPRMVVISPCDYLQTIKAITWAESHKGPVYIRLAREDVLEITTHGTPFEYDKIQKLVEGNQVTLAATGTMVYEALLAAKELKSKHKVSVEVINVHTIKPLDDEGIIESAKKTKLVVTVEDHQVIGGLGSAIAEVLAQKHPTKLIRIGVNDKFGESGTYEELKDKYGLSAHHIVNKVLKELNVE